jgi:hypothetical protein
MLACSESMYLFSSSVEVMHRSRLVIIRSRFKQMLVRWVIKHEPIC